MGNLSRQANGKQMCEIILNFGQQFREKCRLAPDLKTIFHQCVISYTCSQSKSDGSGLEPSELDWLQVYDMTH